MLKSKTDQFWNERPLTETDTKLVNLADLAQRKLELVFISKHLAKDDAILEVGCGNGFLTSSLREIVKSVDSFDYSENMIKDAKEKFGERNNHFFVDNLLEPKNITKQYDAVVCTRVLINLRNLDEVITGIKKLKSFVKPGGKLILLEGFIEGFDELNKVRSGCGIEALKLAAINYYAPLNQVENVILEKTKVVDEFHLGMFDFLTRVVYPSLVGSEKASGYADFHDLTLPVSLNYNVDQFKNLSRMKGWALIC